MQHTSATPSVHTPQILLHLYTLHKVTHVRSLVTQACTSSVTGDAHIIIMAIIVVVVVLVVVINLVVVVAVMTHIVSIAIVIMHHDDEDICF